MLQLKFADSAGSMIVWRVRCTGPEYPSVGSAAPGAGTSGISFSVTTFITLLPYYYRVPAVHWRGACHARPQPNRVLHVNIWRSPPARQLPVWPKGSPDEIRGWRQNSTSR